MIKAKTLTGEPTKMTRKPEGNRKRIGEGEQSSGRLAISTLINDSKLPLNNLTLKTERGLARRVPVRVLYGPLGCLEHKE